MRIICTILFLFIGFHLVSKASTLKNRDQNTQVKIELSEFEINKLYPMPVKSKLTVEFNLKEKGLIYFVVYNIMGNSVFKKEFRSEYSGSNKVELDLTELRSGIYILKAEKDGKVISNRFKKQ